ncbi:calmodulin-like [Centruroides sculpturatus]|uniref:calmodulin-like n=1 Tax=Centruroides sculpturatus TaxID=218467 RepID=UPI000C6D33F4|nr:calmodulin-like [Centruroides sculpturatus]
MSEQDGNHCEPIKELRSMFDADGDGKLSLNSLEKMMKAAGIELEEDELKNILEEIDPDGRGKIDFSKLLSVMAKEMKKRDSDEEIIEAFKFFDKEGTGLVNAAELRRIMTTMGQKLSEQEVDDMIKQANVDENGNIDYCKFIQKMQAKWKNCLPSQ